MVRRRGPTRATIARAYAVAQQLGIHYSPEQGATERLDEFQRLMRASAPHRRGHTTSAATRAKISAALRGRHLSASTRAKISAAERGRTVSAETRAKLSARMRGRTLSPETKHKISEGLKRYYATHPEARARISSRMRGNQYHKGKHGGNQNTSGWKDALL